MLPPTPSADLGVGGVTIIPDNTAPPLFRFSVPLLVMALYAPKFSVPHIQEETMAMR
jgi:hypothetical protein